MRYVFYIRVILIEYKILSFNSIVYSSKIHNISDFQNSYYFFAFSFRSSSPGILPDRNIQSRMCLWWSYRDGCGPVRKNGTGAMCKDWLWFPWMRQRRLISNGQEMFRKKNVSRENPGCCAWHVPAMSRRPHQIPGGWISLC